MKVHRLEISGFKSFVDPVRVDFAGGITAIVGPNGCGKSNLSEAMTWVLGEQSAKSLRGGTMEDVIFNGSDSRKPLGMAECTLTLRTPPSHPGAQEGVITLGRRVFRGGESQYRLNGKLVRLKEIRDLLMDTGLGLRAYSVIEQGKIGMILSGKPLERRKLLEEAAGITRYKARKSVAEVKLQEAMANLMRLDDIIAEVDRALKSLKRQASAARRYQEKEAEYKVLLERVLLGRYSAVSARLGELRSRIEEASTREAGAAADLHRDEAALAAGREELDGLARALAERHQRAAELGATIEGRQEFLKSNRGTVIELAERAAQDRALAERRESEVASHSETLALLEERRLELVAERTQAAQAVTADEEQIAAAERDVRQAGARVESLRIGLLTAVASVNAAKERARGAELELERGGFRRNHLDEELARHGREQKTAADTLTQAVEKVQGLEGALAAKSEDQARVAASLELVMRREAEAVEEKRRLEEQLSLARQRRRVLAELARAHAQKRSALLKALAEVGFKTPQFLADAAKAAAGWERSLDIYLGRLADAVVLPEDESALFLARSLAGRAEAILVEPAHSPAAAAAAWPRLEDPAIVLSLGEALALPESLALAVPPAFLVETGEDAERLARQHPGVAFLSREGVWAQAGTFHVEGERANPGVLERESALAQLEVQIPDLEGKLKAADATVERLVGERAALAREANRLQNETQQLRQELAVGTARRDDAATRHRRLAAEGETLTAERDQVVRELELIEERRQILLSEVAAAEANHSALQEAFDRAQLELEAAQAARESLRTESAGRRGRLELLEERLESHERELARLTAEVERGQKQAEAWREEAERLTARRLELEAALERAESELQAALEQKAEIEDGLLAEQERLDGRRDAIRGLEERIQGHRKRREAVRSEIEDLRVAHAGLRQDAEHVAVSFTEAFERPLPEDPGAPPGDLSDLANLEGELARTKAALERLGPVNLLAVAEHDEQEERFQFLTVQRADVAESVDSLKKTIREINEASSERFRATFDEVNKCFGETFARLFRGGEAEMHLLDESDPLESGIEIVARPPGKRLQNLMLLSGGEKALTAIALLFALFRSKPSPFCILDEVDAPLDDVNTVRFVDLVKELASETQFIVITHNKLTMEAAGSLYGVTMEEKGVSKLVAVKIDDVQPEPVRATA